MQLRFGFVLLGLAAAGGALAQAPGVPIEPPNASRNDARILAQAAALKDAGRLTSLAGIQRQLTIVSNASLGLPAPGRKERKPAEIYQLARQSRVRLGWYYLCTKCEHWHFNSAGAYPIAAGGILATCYHLASGEDELNMREGYLVAVDPEERVYPVDQVVGKSRTMDAAIVHVPGLHLKPLPLNGEVTPGDTVHCYSDPLSFHGVFSQGIVNRFFWNSQNRGARGSPDEIKRLRMNVSCAWAPGSSGCAIFDNCGNVVGHVASWGVLHPSTTPPAGQEGASGGGGSQEKPRTGAGGQSEAGPAYQYYEAIPAAGLRFLAEGLKAKGARARDTARPGGTN